MAASGAESGLRDRKRAQTRQAIRTAGFDLFEEQGFEGTTVDQICRRADVAHRTFFRYYACKEALLFGLDFGQVVLDAFAAAPAGLGLWAAFEHAARTTDGQFEEPAEHTARRRALRRRFIDIRTVHDFAVIQIDVLAQRAVVIAGERLGVDPAVDVRPQVLGAALAGMTRPHVMSPGTANPMEAWAQAFRELVGPGDAAGDPR
ncbi:TetR family transcriptional regulator [Kitasatospora sp. NPDC058201]|uniref:TetR family transcriptional regulator n=1 Tax=Streptomycetaceae TaxID=2062 RepID=UPI002E787A9F|nr:TetR family transcriptional regulator [Streptomyces sp. BE303]MED7950268.1 TetR family transcriptional regulator [Streptomyces sp. BE303]